MFSFAVNYFEVISIISPGEFKIRFFFRVSSYFIFIRTLLVQSEKELIDFYCMNDIQETHDQQRGPTENYSGHRLHKMGGRIRIGYTGTVSLSFVNFCGRRSLLFDFLP